MKLQIISGTTAFLLLAGLARAEGEQFIFKSAAVPKPDKDQVWAFLENQGTVTVECTTTLEVVARNADGDESTLTSQPIKRLLRAGRSERHDYNYAPILAEVRAATGDATWRVRAVPPQAFDLRCERAADPDDPNDPGDPGDTGPAGAELIALGTPGALHIFDAASLNEVNTITGDAGRVVAARPGQHVVATAGPGFVALYDVDTSASLGHFPGPAIPKAAAFSADGLRLFVGGGDDCADEFHCHKGGLYSFDQGTTGFWQARSHVAANAPVTDVSASASDQRIATSGNGVFGFYDRSLAGLGSKTMPASASGASALALGANGTLLLGSGAQIFSCSGSCAQLQPLAQATGAVSQIAFDDRTGRAIVAAAGEGGSSAFVLDSATGAKRALPLKSTERVFNAAHAHGQDLAATAGIDYAEAAQLVLETWDVGAGQPTLRNRKVLGAPQGVWKFGVAFINGH